MSRKISVSYSSIAGTQAGLGRTSAGRTVIADRPPGVAGGEGLGFNGAELLAASLGGCFWNDLHHVSEALGATVSVRRVEAWVDLAGEPPRIVRAHIAVALEGDAAERVFEEARDSSTIAHSLLAAFPIVFERLGA
ncbi:OsmC family protein [Rhodobacter sp. CZR27]|uniref:OsmC family protein n=1 Tax=Rhodobacter sp. CZR27 TaxID=2033869 RepID=UPI000BBF145D|nr:OsmC family protein [Rhodobacter sp. CZR27]